MEFSFELEKYVTINYDVEITEDEPCVTNPNHAGFGPGVVGGVDLCQSEIVITSDSIVDHMIILGELAANYTGADIDKAALEDYIENNQPEPDDCEPEEFDHESHYRDMP